jgi:cation diffusion facilitator family transporter
LGHSHVDSKFPEEQVLRVAWFSIAGNVLLAVIKGLAGILGNSYALIADAIESTTDIFASFLVLLGIRYAKRPPDANHPYGHGKAEPLVTFVVVAFLVVSAVVIAWNSIINLQTPQEVPAAWTLIVLLGIIIWKEATFQMVIRRSKALNSTALKAEAWHHRSDAITSVLAFVGIGIAVVFGERFARADDWAALLASFFIIYNAYLIFRPALSEVMDEDIHEDLIEEIRNRSYEVKGIRGTEKCFVRKSGVRYHIDLHALVDGHITVEEGHKLAHILQDHLRDTIPGLGSILIHIEPKPRNHPEKNSQ